MKRFRIAGVLMALALVVAACGGDDADATTTTTTVAAETGTIVDVATEAGSFSTLLAAADAADLVGTLEGEGPFTVFAPTDEAFAALGEETINSLLGQPEELSQILLYHVVSGTVVAADVVELESASTVEGSPISIEVVDGGVVLNGSVNVVTTDIPASNGVIHVIDAVLLPTS
jgi:transforming growth factor-beta-induced protein